MKLRSNILLAFLLLPLFAFAQVTGKIGGKAGGVVKPSINYDNVKPSDIVAPLLDSAEVGRMADDSVYLFFSESFNTDSIPATTAFTVSGVYGSPSVNAVSVSNDTILLRVASDVYWGDVATVTYTQPSTGRLQDARGNKTASFTDSAVTNNTGFVSGYQAVYNAYTTKPVDSLSKFYNRAVKLLDDSARWTRIDGLYVFANHTNANGEALYNWKNPTGTTNGTNYNSPVHTANQGLQYSGTTNYTNLNFTSSVDGVNYTQNSATFGLYIRTNIAINSTFHGTAFNTDLKDCLIASRYATNFAHIRTNDGTQISSANANGSGLYFNTRTASNIKKLYRNDSPIINGTTASTGVPTHKFYVGACNDDDIATGFRADQVSIVIIMDGMSQTDVTVVGAILNALMTNLGTNVYSPTWLVFVIMLVVYTGNRKKLRNEKDIIHINTDYRLAA